MSANVAWVLGVPGKVSARFRHGLVLRYFQSLLSRAGIEIIPYYWYREEIHPFFFPKAPAGFDDYTFGFLGPEDMAVVAACHETGPSEAEFRSYLEEGRFCYGVKLDGEIAGFSWINLASGDRWVHKIQLGEREAYVHYTHIVRAFRGKGLALALSRARNRALFEMGRTIAYSYVDCLNTPALKLKKRYGSEKSELGLYVELFGRCHCDRVLRQYHHSPSPPNRMKPVRQSH